MVKKREGIISYKYGLYAENYTMPALLRANSGGKNGLFLIRFLNNPFFKQLFFFLITFFSLYSSSRVKMPVEEDEHKGAYSRIHPQEDAHLGW